MHEDNPQGLAAALRTDRRPAASGGQFLAPRGTSWQVFRRRIPAGRVRARSEGGRKRPGGAASDPKPASPAGRRGISLDRPGPGERSGRGEAGRGTTRSPRRIRRRRRLQPATGPAGSDRTGSGRGTESPSTTDLPAGSREAIRPDRSIPAGGRGCRPEPRPGRASAGPVAVALRRPDGLPPAPLTVPALRPPVGVRRAGRAAPSKPKRPSSRGRSWDGPPRDSEPHPARTPRWPPPDPPVRMAQARGEAGRSVGPGRASPADRRPAYGLFGPSQVSNPAPPHRGIIDGLRTMIASGRQMSRLRPGQAATQA